MGRCLSAAVRADAGGRSVWTSGPGISCVPGSRPASHFRWTPLLRDQPADLGRPWSHSQVRIALDAYGRGRLPRRFAPHQPRHAHAVEMAREGVPLNVIQRQLGHANLGVTPIYLQGIDSGEVIETVRTRRAPVIPAAAALAG